MNLMSVSDKMRKDFFRTGGVTRAFPVDSVKNVGHGESEYSAARRPRNRYTPNHYAVIFDEWPGRRSPKLPRSRIFQACRAKVRRTWAVGYYVSAFIVVWNQKHCHAALCPCLC